MKKFSLLILFCFAIITVNAQPGIGGSGTYNTESPWADSVWIDDTGGYYTGDNVETALQEIGLGTSGAFWTKTGDQSSLSGTKSGTFSLSTIGTLGAGAGTFDSLAISSTINHTITDSADDLIFTNFNTDKDIKLNADTNGTQIDRWVLDASTGVTYIYAQRAIDTNPAYLKIETIDLLPGSPGQLGIMKIGGVSAGILNAMMLNAGVYIHGTTTNDFGFLSFNAIDFSASKSIHCSTSNYFEFGDNINLYGDNRLLLLGAGKDVKIGYTGTYWDFDISLATTAIRFNQSQLNTDFIVYGNTGAMLTLDAGTLGATLNATLFTDKIKLTQTDGNEYIDSLNDGYVDIGATTGIRLNSSLVNVTALTATGTVQAEHLYTPDDLIVDGQIGLGTAVDSYSAMKALWSESSANTNAYTLNFTLNHSSDTNSTVESVTGIFTNNRSGTVIGPSDEPSATYGMVIQVNDSQVIGNEEEEQEGAANTYGCYFATSFSGTVTSMGTHQLIGVLGYGGGNMGTDGNTSHFGAYLESVNTAVANFGLYASASGATTNYAIYAYAISGIPWAFWNGAGNMYMGADNRITYWGTGQDVKTLYTGTYWDFDVVNATTAIRFNQSQLNTDTLIYGDTGLIASFDAGDLSTTFGGNVYVPDHGTAATDMVVNVCYGTGDPPAASTTTEGALYVKYIP